MEAYYSKVTLPYLERSFFLTAIPPVPLAAGTRTRSGKNFFSSGEIRGYSAANQAVRLRIGEARPADRLLELLVGQTAQLACNDSQVSGTYSWCSLVMPHIHNSAVGRAARTRPRTSGRRCYSGILCSLAEAPAFQWYFEATCSSRGTFCPGEL